MIRASSARPSTVSLLPSPTSCSFTWEIVIVNDGSRDKTAEITLNEYVAVHGSEHVRLLDLFKNGGASSCRALVGLPYSTVR